MTVAEILAIGAAVEALERPAAKKRQKENLKQNRSGNFPERKSTKGDTRDRVAAAVGVSGRTYEKAKQVATAAEIFAVSSRFFPQPAMSLWFCLLRLPSIARSDIRRPVSPVKRSFATALQCGEREVGLHELNRRSLLNGGYFRLLRAGSSCTDSSVVLPSPTVSR